jgi:methyl-accepting chemotaxis protein
MAKKTGTARGKRDSDGGLGIRGKILLTFTIMALIPLVLIGAFTTYSINDLGDKSIEDSSNALRTQANEDLLTRTSDRAVQVEQFFNDIEADGLMLTEFASDVYNNPKRYAVSGYPDFHYGSDTVPYLPDWGYIHTASDERQGAWGDWGLNVQASPYLNSTVVNRAAADPVYAAELRDEINLTLAFDHVFKPIYDNNQPNAQLVWMVREGGLTNAYQTPSLNYGELLASGELTDDWNEFSEDYVTLADPMNNPNKEVIWTETYFDTVGGGWLISCIGPIYKGSEFIGSVGIDIQLDLILSTVLDISIYKTGHAFLVNTDGVTIAHQDLDNVRDTQMSSDPDDLDVMIQDLESDSAEFNTLLGKFTSSDSGFETVTYEDGEKYYISYNRIEETDFVLGIVVPEAEVLESVDATEEKISEKSSETMMLVLIIDGIALVFILMVGLVVANRIVAPINEVIDISRKLGVGKIDDSLFKDMNQKIHNRKTKKDEIGNFYQSFSNMVSSINKNADKEKEQKQKEAEPIPQQLIQDIKIEIKDSVIHRSTIGAAGATKPGSSQYCLNCGKDLPADFSGQFCPFCGEEP